MSQEQPQRPQEEDFPEQEPITYGDIFNVNGELASKPIAPQDAASMQAAESLVLGEAKRGGPASIMQSAANLNMRAGLVSYNDVTDIALEKGITITESNISGNRVITGAFAGQVLGQYRAPTSPMVSTGPSSNTDLVTIGEALEATALSAGDKPVEKSDAAAIQVAEIIATGKNETQPGGVAAAAQSAAAHNERTTQEESKMTLSDILSDATEKLSSDKPMMQEDVEGVVGADCRNNPNMTMTPGGVAESLVAAARLNQNQST